MKRTAVLVACCAALLLSQLPSAAAPLPLSSRVVKTASDDEFCAALTKIVEEELQDEDACMSEDAVATLMNCMKSMRRAYEAQMAFAVASLEIYRTAKPKRYAEALQAYRMALRTQYCDDLKSLRIPCFDAENEEAPPTSDAFLESPQRNSTAWGVRRQMMQRAELRLGMLRLRRTCVREQIEMRCSQPEYEFLTDSTLNGAPVMDCAEDEPTPRCRKLLNLFDHAEQCWEEYAMESGLSFYYPYSSGAGTDTYFIALEKLVYHLWDHHEAFLAELFGGFCRGED